MTYMVDTSSLTPDAELDALRACLTAGEQTTLERVNPHRRPDGSLPPSESAWLSDYQCGQAGGLALCAVMQSAVAQRRLSHLATFLDVIDAVLAGLLAYCAVTDGALRRRLAWMQTLCEALGQRAGDKDAALAELPPLLFKLHLMGPAAPLARLVEATIADSAH